jgi:hypothetical protein
LLISTITVPLGSIGIELTEQRGQASFAGGDRSDHLSHRW